MPNFDYGATETDYLKGRDRALSEAIDRIGMIEREIMPDLFTGLVNCIVGQQISAKALNTIWARMLALLGDVTPQAVAGLSAEALQKVGITMKKAVYIKQIADAVIYGAFPIDDLANLGYEEIQHKLVSLPGVGVWTAEMLMIFSLQHKDIVSWGDLGIRRGMMMLYQLDKLDKKMFEEYRQRYSPHGTVASLYLWEVSLGK